MSKASQAPTTLGAITEDKVAQSGPPAKGEFVYVDIGSIDIERKRIAEPSSVQVEKAPSRAKQVLRSGDVLVSMTRPNRNAVAIVPDELDGAIGSTGFHVLRARDVEPGWLLHAVQTNDFVDAMCGLVQGALYPAVRPKDIRNYPVTIPPRPVQRQIVAEIEKQFTRLDAGVGALRRVQANLKRYRAAVLKAACEGRLVPTEAELQKSGTSGQKSKAKSKGSHGVQEVVSSNLTSPTTFETGERLLARILADRRKHWTGRGKYKEPTPPDTAKLSKLSEGWTWATAEQLTLLITSGSRGWGEFYSDSGPLFIRAQDIKTDSLKLAGIARVALPEKAEGMRSSVENSDMLITITGANVTKSAIVRGLSEVAFVSQHVALLKPVFKDASPFLFLWTVSPAHGRKLLEQWAYGAGKPGLSLEQIRSLPIAIPPLAEQKRIVAEVERRLSVIDELEALATANLTRATRLRQSILKQAFNGRSM